jgi:hypothetical protein
MVRSLAGVVVLLAACAPVDGPARRHPVEGYDAGAGRSDSGTSPRGDGGPGGRSGHDAGRNACAPMDAARDTADTSCVVIGIPFTEPLFRWDGASCAELEGVGCGCVGADCASAFPDEAACLAAYAGCSPITPGMPDAGGRVRIGFDAGPVRPTAACSAIGLDLVDEVNSYRRSHGLAAIPASPSLCTVASEHTRDLATYRPHEGAGCNLHSWSTHGTWTACCYTSDHARAECMWEKPHELSSYPGIGYENAARGTETPSEAVAAWAASAGHNAVMLNLGTWADHPWRSLGADIYEGYAVLWFGEEADPAR